MNVSNGEQRCTKKCTQMYTHKPSHDMGKHTNTQMVGKMRPLRHCNWNGACCEQGQFQDGTRRYQPLINWQTRIAFGQPLIFPQMPTIAIVFSSALTIEVLRCPANLG